MKVTGEMLIGARAVRGTESTLRAVNPAIGAELEPSFGGGSVADVDAACAPSAWRGAPPSSKPSPRAFSISASY